jgi:hypothetical protein
MEKTESRPRVLALAGLFVVTTIGMAIWVGVTVRRETPIDSTLRVRETLGNQPNPAVVPSSDARATLPVLPSAPAGSNATGRLHIHCVDATTGADLPGLTWVVGTQSGDDRLRDSGTTDASGRATAHNLTQGTLLVFTIRAPPHAQSFTAVDLALGETKDVELRVGAGGRVHGRVLDDLLQPIENAEILCSNDYQPPLLKREIPERSSKVATHTDSLGRYEIENLCSTPANVWIVEGAPRPGSWGDVEVSARLDGASREVGVAVQPGETKEMPDIVLPRARTWRGRVVDTQGHGVEGALLSLNWYRSAGRGLVRGKPSPMALPPDADGFVLLPGETLTRAEGRFEVKNGQEPDWVWVVKPSGVSEMVALPHVDPGGMAEDVLITLKDATSITLELFDVDGKPARVPNPRVVPASSNARTGRGRFPQALRFCLCTSDGKYLPATIRDDGAGGFIAQFEGRIEDASSYALTASGWSPKSGSLTSRLSDGGGLRIELEDQLCVRVHVRMHDLQPSKDPKLEILARVKACLLSEAERAERGVGCCGMGSNDSFPLVNGDRDVILPVDICRAFHVSFFVPGMKTWTDEGMCVPGSEPLSIDVDGRSLTIRDDASSPAIVSLTAAVGGVRAVLIDSVTAKPLLDAQLELRASAQDSRSTFSSHSTDSQLISETTAPVGTWTATVSAFGHRKLDIANVMIREGETTDLGRVALEPMSFTKLIVQEADGTLIAQHTGLVRLCDADGKTAFNYWGGFDFTDGSVWCAEDLPEHILVRVQRHDTNTQWITVDREPEITFVRLAPWHDVDLRIDGVAASYPNANLDVRIRPASMAESSFAKPVNGKPAASYGQTAELEVPVGQPRVFRTRLGPGQYVVEARSPMFQVTTRTFEVGSGDGPVRVDLDSTE